MTFLQRCLKQFLFGFLGLQIPRKIVALLLDRAERRGHGQLFDSFSGLQLRCQTFDFGIFPRRLVLEFVGNLRYRQFLRDFAGLQLSLQLLQLGVLDRGRFLHVGRHLCLGQFDCIALFPFGQFKSHMQLLIEFGIAHLLKDAGVAGRVGAELLVAMWADRSRA